MATRKVVVEVKVKLTMDVEEGVSVDHIISDMDYDFNFEGEEATIYDTDITHYDILEG